VAGNSQTIGTKKKMGTKRIEIENIGTKTIYGYKQ
jgi:hypothetical protein